MEVAILLRVSVPGTVSAESAGFWESPGLVTATPACCPESENTFHSSPALIRLMVRGISSPALVVMVPSRVACPPSTLRLDQAETLAATGAGSVFEVEQYQSQQEQLTAQLEANRANEQAAYAALTSSVGDTQSRVAGVLAQLESAQYDLENTEVKAPGLGLVTMFVLRPGMQASPSRSIATFVYTDEIFIVGYFAQKALRAVKVGDSAKVSFPAVPGKLFETEVMRIGTAVGEGQYLASGQLAMTSEQRTTRIYPILLSIPEEFPPELRKVGLSASATIYTENAGVVGIVATILQWISTSLDLVI